MKRGFTLIEVLAVIIILAVVMLISTPLILNYIKGAEKATFMESVRSVIRSVQLKTVDYDGEDMTFTLKDGIFNPTIKLSKPFNGNGYVITNKQGNIKLQITNGKYCAIKEYSDMDIIATDKDCNLEPDYADNLDTSGATIPQLDSSMIAVRYDGSSWVKADKTNTDKDNQWYDYNAKMWANVAIIKSNKKEEYQNKKLGEKVLEEDIIGYFVGIPKFVYRLTEGTGERALEVVFTDDSVDGYLDHPAFLWATIDLGGFWVAKYEVSGNLEGLRMLPNKAALKNTSLGNVYKAVNELNVIKKKDNSNSKLSEIHLIKNTEWGAIAILSQSKYGICDNNICGKVEKNMTFNTGYADKSSPYDSTKGMLTSTTNNIYGVYDMNGCTWEFTMGTNKPETIDYDMNPNYYNLYVTEGINGDLTTLDGTSGWYSSDAVFINSYKNWFVRGGDANTGNASIFWYNGDSTSGGFRNGFRISYSVKG